MAWQLHLNLIDGELENLTRGRVTGWMRFYRHGKRPLGVILDLAGDFHEDLRGKVACRPETSPDLERESKDSGP